MNIMPSQHTLTTTIRHALLVMMICYVPHFATTPWWLLIIVLAATGYKLLANYLGYPLLNRWIRASLVLSCLIILKIQYGNVVSGGFFIGFLLVFISLKSLEVHTMRDLKVLVLCNFYLMLTALIVNQELWIIAYLLIAVLANLSLMLRLAAPQATLWQIGNKCSKQVLIAIPISIILFYIFPRIATPLWQVPSLSQGHLGFNETMTPGSIAELFGDDSTAFRVTFKEKPILKGYWRGLILSVYDGNSWNPSWYNPARFRPLHEMDPNPIADYEIILEPHQTKWLFYLGNPTSGRPNLLFSPNVGLVSERKDIINQRFAYAFNIQAIPVQPLTNNELIQNTKLPPNKNPRLNDWAKVQFANQHQDINAFVLFLQHYIREQPYWYTLKPPALDPNNNSMDQFWFDTQKGFCEHYASAVTLILRAIGTPARIVVGYQGGEWNPIARYLNIQHNDAHAWLEYWQEGIGWKLFDPTAFIAPERVDERIRDFEARRLNQENYADGVGLSWLQQSKLFLDSARFFAERWFLFYNANAQHEFLDKIGLGQWNMGQLLQASMGCLIIFIILIGLYYQWMQRRNLDPLLIEYHLLQKEFRRFNVSTHPSATLKQQCRSLITKAPRLASTLATFLYRYERLRLQAPNMPIKENKKKTVSLFKALRQQLCHSKTPDASQNK